MMISKDTHQHITIGKLTLFIPDYQQDSYFFITTLAREFGVETNMKAGQLLLASIREEEEDLLEKLTYEYDDGGIFVQCSAEHAEAILRVIFLVHDLMVPPYQMILSEEDKNEAILYCSNWVRPTLQAWKTGDVFSVPLMDGDYAFGQVVWETAEKNPVCALFECRSEEVLEPDYVVSQRPISIMPLQGDQIHNFTFKVIGNAPVSIIKEGGVSEYGGSKMTRFSDSFMTGLANAYYGLSEWDDVMFEYDKFLLPGVEGPYDCGPKPIPNTVLEVLPGEAIGKIRLGMSKEECDEALKSYEKEYKKGHWNYSLLYDFHLGYDKDDKVSFIELANAYEKGSLQIKIQLPENRMVDAFQTKVKTLIPLINQVSPYNRSKAEGGYSYHFDELGLALWRGNVFEEEQMQEAWFQEMCLENQQDELRFLYFESVSVMVSDYYGS